MAITVERTAAEDVTDALAALGEVERYTRDLRAWLEAADRQAVPEPGTLALAGHAAKIVGGELGRTRDFIRVAGLRAAGLVV
jgi:hypothetical protein